MKKNKRAFTLLEVLLAVAILVISSTVIFQGFMSALAYSANTAIYAKDGNANTSQAYDVIEARKGKNKQDGSSGTNMEYDGGGAKPFYTVNTHSYTGHSSDASGLVSAVTDSNISSNRHAVTYAMPKGLVCPDCGSSEYLARDKNDGTDYRWYCTNCMADDTRYIGLPDPGA
jgi:prepilin-type N-terminal cleavage/methylation domain-containing protein